jgi:cell division septum initiation protein DivIVA
MDNSANFFKNTCQILLKTGWLAANDFDKLDSNCVFYYDRLCFRANNLQLADNNANTMTSTEILDALTRLSAQLQTLNDKVSSPKLSHYQQLPDAVSQAYALLTNGAQLVHATSTKYTLLRKDHHREELAQELLRGCQSLGAGCFALHDDASGCARSVRAYSKHACRAIVHTVAQLMQTVLEEEETISESTTTAAQRTGAVWQACSVILERTLPIGNRNTIRRDLFTYRNQCSETMQEFSDLIDLGASEDEDNVDVMNEQYATSDEVNVAVAALTLIKCSRGCINAVLQACDAIGNQVGSAAVDKHTDNNDTPVLGYISQWLDHAHAVGDGMTDLGMAMYPPLQLDELYEQVQSQATAIEALLCALMDTEGIELNQEVVDLVAKLKEAVMERKKQVNEAIQAMKKAHQKF